MDVTSPFLPRTPTKARHGDRFIPNRAGNRWGQLSFLSSPPSAAATTPKSKDSGGRPLGPSNGKKEETSNDDGKGSAGLYGCLLKNEVLGYQIEDVKDVTPDKRLTADRKLFNYDNSERESSFINSPWSPYSTSPISKSSEKLLQRSARKSTRRIAKTPFKVLDAPELKDDFYLNLVDWSSQNCIAVGLGSCVYLWSATTSNVIRLCDLSPSRDSVTSVGWNDKGKLVAVGTNAGLVEVWDVTAEKLVTTIRGHTARVGTVAWNGDIVASGSKDQFINCKDIRTAPFLPDRQLIGHTQEICGLKWSPDNQLLASGGNDNRLHIWSLHSSSSTPIQSYSDHTAAVKAISWSPHHHGVLASGGGTADKTIRFWNTVTGQPMQFIHTGSQVCNLAWSKHSSEFVTTHGYSQNQILIWKYPSLQHVAELTGHSNRVLYLSMSPDGENIVTGAGDETLRFWNVFKKRKSQKENSRSILNLYDNIR